MAEEKIGLQDFGTGIDTALEGVDNDWASAADVGAAVAAAGGEMIVAGFEFDETDVDTTAGEATIPAGQAVLLDSNVSDGRTSMEWLRAAFPVRHPGGTVALATSGDTNVWLDAEPQATTPDEVELVTGSTPTEPRLLLGTIAEDGTVTLQNRHRSPAFDEVTAELLSAKILRYGDPALQNDLAGRDHVSKATAAGQWLNVHAHPDTADGDMDLEYFSQSGYRVGSMSYHVHDETDDGGHWKVYVSEAGSGQHVADHGIQSRFHISANGDTRFENTGIVRQRSAGNTLLSIEPSDGSQYDTTLRLGDNNGNAEPWQFVRKSSNQRLNLEGSSGSVISFYDNGVPRIDVNGSRFRNLREVGSNPTASDLFEGEWAWTDDHDGAGSAAWLYKNGAGTLHYFEPTGTK